MLAGTDRTAHERLDYLTERIVDDQRHDRLLRHRVVDRRYRRERIRRILLELVTHGGRNAIRGLERNLHLADRLGDRYNSVTRHGAERVARHIGYGRRTR